MTAVLLFDGDCGFCTTSAGWLERRAPSSVAIAAWQLSDLEALGLTAEECLTEIQYAEGPHHLGGAAAIAAYLRGANRFWRVVGTLLGSCPVLLVAEPAYRLIARYRYRLPGGTPACRLER